MWVPTENLFRAPTLRATAWIERYSITTLGLKNDRVDTGHGFGRLAVDADAIWVANATSETVTRIERRGDRVDSRAELGRTPIAIAIGTEATWVLGINGWLWRFHADGEGEGVARTGRGAQDLVCDQDSVWVLHGNGDLVAIDQPTGETVTEAKIHRGGRQLLHIGTALIALTAEGMRVCRVAKDGGAVEAEAKLPDRGIRAVVQGDVLWVACGRRRASRWGALVPVDLATMAVGAPLDLPSAPRAIATAGGHLWVACGRRGDKKSAVVRVEPTSGEIEPWVETDWTIYDLAIAGDELLAATGLTLAGPAAGVADGGGMGGAGGHHGGHHGGGVGGGEGGGGGN